MSASATPTIPQNAPAGGVSMIDPNPTDQVPLYKIMDNNPITFSWSYTSLIQTPTSITLDAFCEQNGQTYAVSPPTGIAGADTEYVWNPANDVSPGGAAVVLPQASYSLRIYDQRGPLVAPSPGVLSPLTNVRFALYSPGGYTGLADGWTCVACTSSALSFLAPPSSFPFVVSFILLMFSVMFLRLRATY